MDRYLTMVMDYINRTRTNYALLLSGDWGNGKTHFITTVVFPELLKEGKKPIYISLNGVNSIEELSKQIYFETSFLSDERIKKVIDSKSAKTMSQLFKILHNGASLLNLAGSTEQKIDYEEITSLGENIILCFDDLERCRIDIVELLGYLNKFVEHDEIKTLIVGNEKEIKDITMEQNRELKMLTAAVALKGTDEIESPNIIAKLNTLFIEQKVYEVIKEKLIGKTIFYEPNSELVVQEVVGEFKELDNSYYLFLEANIEHILFIFNKSERKNIRILKHSLGDFQKAFNILQKIESSDFKENIIIKSFIPSLIFGIEYRSGNITQNELKNLKTTRLTQSSFIMLVNDHHTHFSNYLKGYSVFNEYYILETIQSYIVSSLIIEQELIEEAADIIESWTEISTGEKEKNPLSELIENFFELENEEFEMFYIEVLKNVKQGFYPIDYYTKIFLRFEYFSNKMLVEENIEELKALFIEGISKAKLNSNDSDRFPRIFIENKSSNLQDIENKVSQRIKSLKDTDLEEKMDAFIDLLPENVDEFIQKYYQLAKGNTEYKAIMQYIDTQNYFEKLKALKNSELIEIRNLYSSIYSFSNINEYYSEDLKHMKELVQIINENLENFKGITLLAFKLIAQDLEKTSILLGEEKQI